MPDKTPPARRRRIRIVVLVVLVAAVIAGIFWLLGYLKTGRYLESTDDAYLRADSVAVAPKIAGYVEQVLVADNQDVQAGQPLVRVDPRDYKAKAAQSRSQIDVARANADAVRAQIVEQQSAIQQARTVLATAEAAAAYANAEVQRYAPLVKTGAETAEQFAAKKNQARQADLDVARQRAAVVSSERKVSTLQAQVRQAEAQGETAQAQLTAADVDLQSTTVTAGIAGRIGDQTVRVGQYVQPGTRLMSLVPLDKLYITANFKETQIGRMRVGQPATVKVDALPGLAIKGRVQSVAPGTGGEFSLLPPQNATGNFTKIVQRVPVRIALELSEATRRVLVPGLSVGVTVDTIDAKDDLKQMQREEAASESGR